ncbi:MAG: phosphoenolpyruvate carboxykinase (ATP), partial [Chloroflexota bacterium]
MNSKTKHLLPAKLGLENVAGVYWQLSTAQLYEKAILNREGYVSKDGPLIVRTGKYTGRTPKDRFIVREPSTENDIHWSDINQPIGEDVFDQMLSKVQSYLDDKHIYVQNCFAGQDPNYRMPVTVITEMAYHSWFVRNMFVQATQDELDNFETEFTVLQAPGCTADPETDGVRSEAFILIHPARKLILIGGTYYTGEIKKGIFGIMNMRLPLNNVLSMHCSANEGPNGDTALFFGLSGTGKTTLSSDQSRHLIGDDEHAWTDTGVFNIEGGCYAKAINLSEEKEPEIFGTTRKFGTIIENVVFDPATREVDYDDGSITQNTRLSYPITSIPNVKLSGLGGHPKNIVFLTADAFGVMPPVSKLTREQAMYHFLSGYTAKVAGTEAGMGKGAQATFSTCFGEPFLPLNPAVYANLLGEKIDKHDADVWLVNTGWTGGPYGVGERMSLKYTRAMINAILDGTLADEYYMQEPHFGLYIPTDCRNVPSELLDPRNTWVDKAAYDRTAQELVERFVQNFENYDVDEAIVAAGPQ